MGKGKVLGGLAFLILGIVLLILGIVPIPGMEGISLYTRIMQLIAAIGDLMATMNIQAFLENTGWLSMAIIIPWIGAHYCIAGIKSMRYDKEKKRYYYSETKIGFMIAGFIIICIAVVLVFMIFLELLSPSFDFLVGLIPTLPPGYEFLLPQLLIPVILSILIIFFVYWIGSKIMKHGVKKEEMF